MSKAPLTYAQAGVDIDAGNKLVERIKPLAKATARAGTMGGIGGFGALFDLKAAGFKDPILVSTTDGVGTKIKLAIDANYHETIGIDLVAMCVNDLIVQGASPLFFLDYFATSKLDVDVCARVIAGIAEGCKQSNCALVGGETAEMPGMYASGDYDLAGFAVGAAERDQLLPLQTAGPGDVLLGLASSGFHSNGYSLIRKVVKDSGLSLQAKAPFDASQSLAQALLTPTRIYVKNILLALRENPQSIKALAHITGGGFVDNIPRVLPESVSASIMSDAFSSPPMFDWLQKTGNITDAEMLRTFNCGVGMVLVVDAEQADSLTNILTQAGETVFRLGQLVPRQNEAVVFI